ncbi:3-keto-5-aminohexanoate cleavage protein, partial [Phyllobacterium brassicacearum]
QVKRSEPDIVMTIPPMPAPIEVTGVEFVEFAANEEEARELASLLHTLGFRQTGTHKTKQVARYSQGGINLVINTEREGFAHSSYAVHGTSAYALGLKVADAHATVARARALGAEPFAQAVGPSELGMPAIRGVGGGVLYFVDDKSELKNIWAIEFDPVADEAAGEDAGLLQFDHVAQTMNFDEMLTWLLFYTSILKTRKTPMVDIIDPAGIVRSQVVENDTGALRITMNGAENRRTLAGHFLAEKFGSSIQHLAFRTDNIFATAEALKANGFVPLQISPNYYDDIEARFGLDPDFSDRLKEANILYDRDDNGEYFQLYSPNYGEGFFFEIVERKGYKGYGAPNAIFRIAAQKRYIRPLGMPKGRL